MAAKGTVEIDGVGAVEFRYLSLAKLAKLDQEARRHPSLQRGPHGFDPQVALRLLLEAAVISPSVDSILDGLSPKAFEQFNQLATRITDRAVVRAKLRGR